MNEVRQIREELQYTQEELADKLNKAPSSVARWERGDPPRESTMVEMRAMLARKRARMQRHMAIPKQEEANGTGKVSVSLKKLIKLMADHGCSAAEVHDLID